MPLPRSIRKVSFFIGSRVLYANSVRTAPPSGRNTDAMPCRHWLIGVTLWWTFAGPAWAVNECGTGLTVRCNGSGSSAGQKNPYANGISYTGTDINLTVTGKVAVDTSGAAENDGPYTVGIGISSSKITKAGSARILVEAGATITTRQDYSRGVSIRGTSGDSSGTVINYGNITTFGADARAIFVQVNNNATVVSAGSVSTRGATARGLYAQSLLGGDVSVTNSGTVQTALANGIEARTINTGTVDVTQSGTVDAGGTTSDGIFVEGGALGQATVRNTGSVRGATGLLVTGLRAAVSNIGSLTGTRSAGLRVAGGAVAAIDNGPGASISGQTGIDLQTSGNVVRNRGRISGDGGTAIRLGGNNNALELESGSVLDGDVLSAGSGNTLTLRGSAVEDSRFVGAGDSDGFSTLIMAGDDWTLGGDVDLIGTAADTLSVRQGRLTLGGNVDSHGGASIARGATLRIGNAASSGAFNGAIVDDGVLEFDRADATIFSRSISGDGSVVQRGSGTLTLDGTNSYRGMTRVEAGTLRLDSARAISGAGVSVAAGAVYLLDFAATPQAWTFDRRLEGAGTVRVDLGASTAGFRLGTGAGAAFAGTLALGRSHFDLDADQAARLGQATLQLESGNITAVDNDRLAFGRLSIAGGALVLPTLAPAGIISEISAGGLDLQGGSVQAYVPDSYTPGEEWDGRAPTLLRQDDTIVSQLIRADGITGSASRLELIDQHGTVLGPERQIGIEQHGQVVAIGDYGFYLSTGAGNDGLYVAYGLHQLDIQAGQLLHLTGDDGTRAGSTMNARLTGSGNLLIEAAGSITLNNAANDYTGTTQVSGNTLVLGNDGVLGQTSQLGIDAGATVAVNGHIQGMGALLVDGSLALSGGQLSTLSSWGSGRFEARAGSSVAFGGGGLSIGKGGAVAAGTLSGSGLLTLTGGELLIDGANPLLAVTTQIGAGASAILNDAAGLGQGAIFNDGLLRFDAVNGTLHNALDGLGNVQLAHSSMTLSGISDGFAGRFDIDADSRLTVTDTRQLGSASVTDDGVLIIDASRDGRLPNALSGAGELVKRGSGVVLAGQGLDHRGGTRVEGGGLLLDDASVTLGGGGPVTIAGGATFGGYGVVVGDVGNDGYLLVADAAAPLSASGGLEIRGALDNRGGILLGGAGVGNALVLRGDYRGTGSAWLRVNARLEGDDSPADRLSLEGGRASGETVLQVVNVGGAGAQTRGDGILLIETRHGGSTDAQAFRLGAPVLAGPYAYRLYRGGQGGDTADNWYLRSERSDGSVTPDGGGRPDYRSETSLYAVVPAMALAYGQAMLATREARSADLSAPLSPAGWGRVIDERGHYDGGGVQANGPRHARELQALQAGRDLLLHQGRDGSVQRGGLYLAIGQASATVDHDDGRRAGNDQLDGYTLGGYWNWQADRAACLDVVAQASQYRVRSASPQVRPLHSRGYGGAVSLAAGFPLRVDPLWRLTPQVRLSYQRIRLDDASDGAAQIRFGGMESLQTRIGLLGERTSSSVTAWARAGLAWEAAARPTALFSSDNGDLPFRTGMRGMLADAEAGFDIRPGRQIALRGGAGWHGALNGSGTAFRAALAVRMSW